MALIYAPHAGTIIFMYLHLIGYLLIQFGLIK